MEIKVKFEYYEPDKKEANIFAGEEYIGHVNPLRDGLAAFHFAYKYFPLSAEGISWITAALQKAAEIAQAWERGELAEGEVAYADQ